MGRLYGSKDGMHTMVKVICAFCQNPFEVYPARIRKGAKYCSRQCKNKDLIGKTHTAEHNRNIGIGSIGKKHSKKSKILMSIAQKNRFKINPMLQETKNKLSISHSGENSSKWKGGKARTIEGYILIYNPSHPFRNSNNYILEHRLVMEKHRGRYLKPTEIVHHINGIVDDNRIENLQLFDDWKKHIAFHKSTISPLR